MKKTDTLRSWNFNLFKQANIHHILLTIILSQFFFLFVSTHTHAHKVNIYASREENKILGECYFIDGKPCKNSKVEVYNINGIEILETITDEKGKFSFTTKEKSDLKIIISAGEGHRAEYKIKGVIDKKEIKDAINKDRKNQSEFQHSINKEELKQIIDEVMDAKLHGLKGEIIDIRKQMDKINIRDIIGGIGYILGFWGIIMLLRRKKNAS